MFRQFCVCCVKKQQKKNNVTNAECVIDTSTKHAFQKKSFGENTKFHHSAALPVLTISLSRYCFRYFVIKKLIYIFLGRETARVRLIEINVLFHLLKIVLILFIKGSSRVSLVQCLWSSSGPQGGSSFVFGILIAFMLRIEFSKFAVNRAGRHFG